MKPLPENANPTSPASSPEATQQAGMSDREKLIREGFCFDSDRDCDAARYLIGVIDTIRGDRNRLRQHFETTQQAAEQASGGQAVKIAVGTSVLTRDLVWCECSRGLSLSGNWRFCPNCGRSIDQESYAAAVEKAKTNGASHFYRDPELVEELAVAARQSDELRSQLANMGALLTENRNLRDDLKTQLAETRGIARELQRAVDMALAYLRGDGDIDEDTLRWTLQGAVAKAARAFRTSGPSADPGEAEIPW